MSRLKDKVAVITGASGGMGQSHSKRFIEEGAKVIVAGRMNDKIEDFAKSLGENALFIELDVTNEDSWKKMVEKTEEAFGPIDILVNNAGIVKSNSIQDTSYDDYKKTILVNQDGVFLGLKYVYPSMKKAGGGSIVNISSIAGLTGGMNQAAYVASKFAVTGLTKAAAAEYAKDNIRVNSVHPGTIKTPMTEQEDVKDLVQALIDKTPLGRLAQPEEITELVLFLASDASSYSTGTEFIADGGLIQQF